MDRRFWRSSRAARRRRGLSAAPAIRLIYWDMNAGGLGGAEGNRTPDLLNAIQALSQLSYGPDR
jgi:hypothetical protein